MSEAYDWGREAEQIAADYLAARGYTVRERRWAPGPSRQDLDIIAQSGDWMVFVEVKARADGRTDPAAAVDRRKQANICRSADAYLRMQERPYSYRFDIISISGTAASYRLEHIEDAFMPPLTCRR